MRRFIRIHPSDNVMVALEPLQAGLTVDDGQVCLKQDIPMGHKFAVAPIASGEDVIKYGDPIGHAVVDILPGEWVHTHNMITNLKGEKEYVYEGSSVPPLSDAGKKRTFMGFVRQDGHVGIRNSVFIVPTVGCVNKVAQELAEKAKPFLHGSVDHVIAFPHDTGCAQMGDDEDAMRILSAIAKHPNAGGALVLGLGCETNRIDVFQPYLGDFDRNRIRFLQTQDVEDEIDEGLKILKELIDQAAEGCRQEVGADRLIVGMKCGGSDGMSGITANPVIGRLSDLVIAQGGTTILTEVPEMFGAEQLLMRRASDRQVFDEIVEMINGFKRYLLDHGRPVNENPTPGNKDGGITTLEDKSLGCTQKSGSAPVTGVIQYAGHVEKTGLQLLNCPAFDLVSTTALAAAGAQLTLFSTGRGTPFSSPVPTIKISTNAPLAQKKKDWIDFDASVVLEERSYEQAGEELLDLLLRVASGDQVISEKKNYFDLAIFRRGVTV
ncbi:MAG: altronate dehydratase [Clostridia bacterium]|nr:altronate dehydratase [Clostridia bacterium]